MALKYPMGMIARAVVLNLITNFMKDVKAEPDTLREAIGVDFNDGGRKLSEKQLERLAERVNKQTTSMFARFNKQVKAHKQRQKDKANGKIPKKVAPPGFGKKKANAKKRTDAEQIREAREALSRKSKKKAA